MDKEKKEELTEKQKERIIKELLKSNVFENNNRKYYDKKEKK